MCTEQSKHAPGARKPRTPQADTRRNRTAAAVAGILLVLSLSAAAESAPGEAGADSTRLASGRRNWPALGGQAVVRLGDLGRQLGTEFLRGILRANYRETAPGDVLPLTQIPLPKPRLPAFLEHPALLFRRTAWPRLRSRLRRPPYSDWADLVLFEARTSAEEPSSPLLNEGQRSSIAKLNAFAYVITGEPRFRETALSALRNIAEPARITTIEGGRRGVGWGDWLEAADALRQYAVAYDLLAASLSVADQRLVERKLAAETELLAGVFALVPENNHTTIIAIGVGSAALALADAPGLAGGSPQEWLDVALTQLSSGLAQIEPDGTYREGAYYARFVASRLYPFALYLYNVTGENLLAQPRLRRFGRWLLDIEKPDGSVPDFDDAFPEAFLYQPIAVGLSPDSGELRAAFERNRGRHSRFDANMIEALCAFDDRVQPAAATGRATAFYPNGGMAVFRKMDAGQDLYALFLGEPGRPHLSWHDHTEPTAFTLSAFGRDLLIDAGYGPGGVGDPDRAWFTSGQAHNIPLVDGLGPDQNPVWGDRLGGRLSAFFETEALSSATVSARYRGTDVVRRVWFVGRRYFVVVDQLSADEPKSFSIPWHGLGEFEIAAANRVRWNQGDVRLQADFIAATDVPLTVTPQTGRHTLTATQGVHTAAVVHLPEAAEQQLLTLLLPANGTDGGPAVESVPVLSSTAASARRLPSADGASEDLLVVAQGPWQSGLVESDASIALVREDAAAKVEWLSLVGATYVRVAGEELFAADRPVSLFLVLDEAGWYGYLSSPEGEATVRLSPPTDPGVVFFNKRSLEQHWQNGQVSLTIRGAGPVEMGISGRRRVYTVEPLRQNYPLLEWLRQSANATNLVAGLSPAQRVQLRNEILAALGSAGLQWSDSLLQKNLGAGPGATSQIYRLSAGFLNSLYNPAGLARLRLPQVIDLRQNWGGRQVQIYEEGILTQAGLRVRRQQLTLTGEDGGRLRLQHERLFEGQESSSIEVRGRGLEARLRLQKWRARRGYSLGLDRRGPAGWLSFRHSADALAGGRTTMLAAGRGGWSSTVSLARPGDGAPWTSRVDVRRTSAVLASTLVLRAREGVGVHTLALRNAWRILPQVAFESELLGSRQPSQAWNSLVRTRLLLRSGPASGAVLAERTVRGQLAGRWIGVFRRGSWRADSRGRFGARVPGKLQWSDLGLAHRTRRFSWQARLRRPDTAPATEAQVALGWRSWRSWTASGRANWHLPARKLTEGAVGFTRGGATTIGAEVGLDNRGAEILAKVTGILGLPLGRMQGLHLYATSLVAAGGRIRGYEIILTQWGPVTTPGLLLSRDRRGQLRFEGHLVWLF